MSSYRCISTVFLEIQVKCSKVINGGNVDEKDKIFYGPLWCFVGNKPLCPDD
jgi:hypothetical protein